jgi:thioredoxin reductase
VADRSAAWREVNVAKVVTVGAGFAGHTASLYLEDAPWAKTLKTDD